MLLKLGGLSSPLVRLNATLSLRYSLDHNRTPSAVGIAIVRPYLTLSRIHAQVGSLDRPDLKPFGRLNPAVMLL